MNVLTAILWCLTASVTLTGSSALDIGNIRLANGTGPYGGRVEVSINGVWGTICDDDFDMVDAQVLCRMMNLRASTILTGAWFGEGIGPIYAQELQCTGRESHPKDCAFVPNVQCTHARDVGIICTECSEIEISNGNAVDVSANGTLMTTICKQGFKSSITTSTCTNGLWSPSSITCKFDIAAIRLVNGLGLYDGRIELLVNNTWGTVCGTSFSWPEARAVCNIMFGTTWYRSYVSTSIYYGQGTGPVYIDMLECSGSETDINECSYSLDISCTDHSRDAAVSCNVQPLNITDTRLVNGTGPYDGRIEFYVDGHWGTICNRNIDMYDARTICSTHNASLVMYFTTTVYGEGSGPVLIDSLHCSISTYHIRQCTVYSPYRPYCTHANDLSIVCTPCGLPQIYNGEAFSFNSTELTVKCQPGFFPDYIKMRCLGNGTWVEDQRCTSYTAYPLYISDIRLNYYYLPSRGRVEILVNDTWGTVCDTNFDSVDASVICRMFGWKYSHHYIKANGFGRGSGAIFVDNLNCTGTENHINNCSYDISNYCTHYDDVGVACTGYQLNITNIRLAGTNGPYHGRIELEVNGTWGTVCDNSYSSSDAQVICRMFGLTYRSYYHNAHFGPGSGPIYIDRLLCNSYETHINDCKHAVNNYYNCDHGDDASVMCYGPKLNITDARLANGTGPYDGRAEIKVNDTWGTICDENFNLLAADYFCQLLRLRATQIFTGAQYGEGSGPVFIDQIFCEESDGELSSCKYLFLNECSHERDISVVCNECGQPDISHWDAGYFTYNGTTLYADCSYYRTYVGTLRLTCDNETQTWVTDGECQEYSYPLNITDVRLTGGPRPSSGRIQVKSFGTWGTICDDNFGMTEANVICNMIGYPPAVTYHMGAYYGEGEGPIFVDDLSCGENALQLNDCTYKTYDDCTHSDDISVVCTDCGDPTPENGYVNSSSTLYQTAVHVSCDKNYELIGDTDIVCQLNAIWSSTPICKLIDCGNPNPEHGSSNSTATFNASVVQIECDKGYIISGEAVIKCQPNGNWSDYPSCEIIDITVQPFYIEGHYDEKNVTVDEHDSHIFFKCIVDSNAAITMTIMFENDKLMKQGNGTSLSYSIPDVSCSDAGVYTCEASYGYTRKISNGVTLFVKCSPRPFRQLRRNITTDLYDVVTLSFSALAYPEPGPKGFSWHKKTGERWLPLLSNADMKVSSSDIQSNLTLFNVSEDDFGQYKVIVRNEIGTYEQFLFLTERKDQHDTNTENQEAPSDITALIVGIALGTVCCALAICATYFIISKTRLLREGSKSTGGSQKQNTYTNPSFASEETEGRCYEQGAEDFSALQYTDLCRYLNSDEDTYDVIKIT